jgi:hypothetical protein
MVADTVTADFMPIRDQLFQHYNVVVTPVYFPPIVSMSGPAVVSRIVIGNQKKRGHKMKTIQHRERLLELASEPIVEGQGNDCRGTHRTIITRLAVSGAAALLSSSAQPNFVRLP